MVLQWFWLILIVGPRPIFGVSYACLWFSLWLFYVFAMFPVDFNRRPLPDPQLSYDFPCFSIGFPMVLLCFRLILIVGPRPILGHLMMPMVFHWFPYGLICFRLILIVGPRPIFGYLMISYGFLMVFLWFCYDSG